MVILNYPGSKRRLLEYILKNTKKYIDKNKYVFDIFSGTGCVAEMYAENGYKVIANDSEKYAYNIATSLLKKFKQIDLDIFLNDYNENYNLLNKEFMKLVDLEGSILSKDSKDIISFDYNLPKVYNDSQIKINGNTIRSIDDLKNLKDKMPYCLFTLYFSGVYFGLKQSMEIDSIRYAIEKSNNNKEALFSCLYFAMKEASFSKDGHMAQPMSHEKNLNRLLKKRKVNITDVFILKLTEYSKNKNLNYDFKSYCYTLEQLLEKDKLFNGVGFVYADPPYTDMQYSRYFHLLNTVTEYDYPNMTMKNGKLTTGLYTDNRYQSPLSNHGSAAIQLSNLIELCSKKGISLCFSYAFPVNTLKQATDRYTMSIDELKKMMREKFNKVYTFKENFKHCNNRNSNPKDVFEYLIVGSNQNEN